METIAIDRDDGTDKFAGGKKMLELNAPTYLWNLQSKKRRNQDLSKQKLPSSM
jgi:hypothetical protein